MSKFVEVSICEQFEIQGGLIGVIEPWMLPRISLELTGCSWIDEGIMKINNAWNGMGRKVTP